MSACDISEPGSCPPSYASENEPQQFFRCPVCLDLAYKPVVHSCGHVFCFWCTFHSLDGIRQSRCPVCRRACSHFPKICEMLHFLLMKLMPEEYRRRAQETQEYETSEQMFSPDILPSLRTHCKYDYPAPTKSSKLPDKCSTEALASTSGGLNCLQSPLRSSKRGKEVISLQQQTAQSPLALSKGGQEEGQLHSFSGDQMYNELTAVDFSCTTCKQFLFKPVVLHCGEVFCQGCVANSDSIISCPACGGGHPGGSVNICLDLQHYLESAFPESVLERNADASQNGAQWTVKESTHNSPHLDGSGNCQVTEETQAVHILAGCDGCGMHPIIGERYQCEDCPEKVGYDLCGDCFEKTTTWDGRFNQQHTANHRMRKILIERVSLPVLSSYYVFLENEDLSEHSANGHDDVDAMETEI